MNQEFISKQIISDQGQVITQNTNTILFDDSFQQLAEVKASLQAFAQLDASSKVLLLADLDKDNDKHQKMGEVVKGLSPALVIFHGKAIQQALVHNSKAYYFPDKFSLHNWLADKKFQHNHLLILGGKTLNISTVLQFI